MAGQNVVEVVVKAANLTQPGFAGAKAGAEETAGAMDSLAAAQDRVTEASIKYSQAQGALIDAQLRLSDVETSDGGASEAALAAARDKVTAATLRQADAQITLLNAEARQEAAAAAAADASVAASAKTAEGATAAADAQKAQGDAALASGGKSAEAGGLMAGMGAKVKMAGLGVAVGMGLAVKSAMDFQQVSTKWVTSAGENVNQLGMLQQGVLKLSSQTATSSTELSNGLYMISSAGITGAGGLSVLKAAAEGAKSEGADLTEVTNALTSGINAYGMKTKTSAEATVSATSMMNQMLATVSAGKMTFQELAGSLSAVLPIAASNHIAYAQVGGALAVMTSMGVSAQQGTQNLAATIRSLVNPTNVATNEMAQFGLSSTEVAKNVGRKGLTGTIQELSDAVTAKMGPSGTVIVNAMNQSKSATADATQMLGMLPKSIQGVAKSYLDGSISTKAWTTAMKAMPMQAHEMASQFGSVAARAHGFNSLLSSGAPAAQTYAAAMSKMLGGATGLNVGLMLTGQHAKTFADNVKSISAASNGASGEVSGFADVTKETSFQAGKAADSIKAAGISLGLALLPAVNAVLTPLASFLSFISQNKAAAIALAVVVGGVLAGAIGTKAVHALTEFKSAVETTVGGIQKLMGKLFGLGGAAEASAAEQGAAAGEAAAADDAAAAESSGSWLASFAQRLAAGAAWVAQSVAKVAVVVASNVAGALSTAAAWVAANAVMLLGIGAVVALVAVAVYEIVTHWKSIVNGVREAWDAVFRAVSTAVSAVVGFVKQHWELLLAILLGPIAVAVLEIAKHWDTIRNDASKFASDVTGTVSRLASGVLHFFERMWDDLGSAERRGTSLILGDVTRWLSDFLRAEVSGLDSIVHWFAGLPGRILGALGDLGSLLFGSGERIIQGLINGVTSMIGDVGHAIGGIVSEVRSYLPFSPARKGPLSGGGAPENSGRSIAAQLARGITSGAPAVSEAMARMAGSAALRPGAGGAGAGGGLGRIPLDVTFSVTDSQIMTAIMRQVRTMGGDPDMFIRKVAFR